MYIEHPYGTSDLFKSNVAYKDKLAIVNKLIDSALLSGDGINIENPAFYFLGKEIHTIAGRKYKISAPYIDEDPIFGRKWRRGSK